MTFPGFLASSESTGIAPASEIQPQVDAKSGREDRARKRSAQSPTARPKSSVQKRHGTGMNLGGNNKYSGMRMMSQVRVEESNEEESEDS
jgi:hypothetical protein